MSPWMGWAQMALATPVVVLWCGWPFFEGAGGRRLCTAA